MSYSRRAHSFPKAVHNKKKAVFPPVRFIWANQYIYNSLGVAVPPVRDIPAEMVAVSRPLQVYHHSQRRPKSAQPPLKDVVAAVLDSPAPQGVVLQYLAQAFHFLGGGFSTSTR